MFKDIFYVKKITRYKLAKLSSVSYTTINELYRGERTIDDCCLNTVRKIAKTLNMELNDFIELCEKRVDIPVNLYKFFWDCDAEKLNCLKDKRYIITRLLDKGGYMGLVFLKNAYTYQEIKDVAKKQQKSIT